MYSLRGNLQCVFQPDDVSWAMKLEGFCIDCTGRFKDLVILCLASPHAVIRNGLEAWWDWLHPGWSQAVITDTPEIITLHQRKKKSYFCAAFLFQCWSRALVPGFSILGIASGCAQGPTEATGPGCYSWSAFDWLGRVSHYWPLSLSGGCKGSVWHFRRGYFQVVALWSQHQGPAFTFRVGSRASCPFASKTHVLLRRTEGMRR